MRWSRCATTGDLSERRRRLAAEQLIYTLHAATEHATTRLNRSSTGGITIPTRPIANDGSRWPGELDVLSHMNIE